MRYTATIRTAAPESIVAQPGQWIDYQGARGRYYGRRNGVTWIAWGTTATRRFKRFASVARNDHATAQERAPNQRGI